MGSVTTLPTVRARAATSMPSDAVLDVLAADAPGRDAAPRFPRDAMELLADAGALGVGAVPGAERPPASHELSVVRRIAAADASVARIVDGHLNACERVAVQGPAELHAELAMLADGRLFAGVWGADPAPGEGEPAVLRGDRLDGVKVFCSGAGGLKRALVLCRLHEGPPVSAWVDTSEPETVRVDPSWYRATGLRASESHRVVFSGAPVLAVLGGPGALSEQPWFGRDALRTSATWAGLADLVCHRALELLAQRAGSELESLAAGRILTHRGTIDRWLEHAAAVMDRCDPTELPAASVHARDAIASACRAMVDEALRATGSRPLATGDPLDRARRDLDVFLLQHRLDPLVARRGAAALEERR